MSPFYEDISGIGPTLLTSFQLDYLRNALSPNLVAFSSTGQGDGGLGLQHKNFEGAQFNA